MLKKPGAMSHATLENIKHVLRANNPKKIPTTTTATGCLLLADRRPQPPPDCTLTYCSGIVNDPYKDRE